MYKTSYLRTLAYGAPTAAEMSRRDLCYLPFQAIHGQTHLHVLTLGGLQIGGYTIIYRHQTDRRTPVYTHTMEVGSRGNIGYYMEAANIHNFLNIDFVLL